MGSWGRKKFDFFFAGLEVCFSEVSLSFFLSSVQLVRVVLRIKIDEKYNKRRKKCPKR
jgi:hypothetical protein